MITGALQTKLIRNMDSIIIKPILLNTFYKQLNKKGFSIFFKYDLGHIANPFCLKGPGLMTCSP
ncbi:MAG: hypothetical protein Barrevirus6_16 [Barrevirus sp.]|uniref:Uncharacterized protein n=1 Tax=Barrevirus sp. TaxID=2487763 RepID=A0A3G4ZPZ7_9VIRU|nr:MAG: hypothetical protein Barrevirus6_16 [Barrevirus sp.]